LLFLACEKACAQHQDAESLFHQLLDVASAAGQRKLAVIPSENASPARTEGSR